MSRGIERHSRKLNRREVLPQVDVPLVSESSETRPLNAPTTLTLWPSGTNEGLRVLQARVVRVGKFKHEFGVASDARGEYQREVYDQSLRQSNVQADVSEQLNLLRSARIIGMGYLKIADELSAEGRSSDEIREFFHMCLKYNLRNIADDMRLVRQKRGDRWVFAAPYRLASLGNAAKDLPPPPAWFHGTPQIWTAYVVMHADFSTYVARNVSELKRMKSLSPEQRNPLFFDNDTFGAVFRQGLPEWVNSDAIGEELPEIVRKELEEDTEAEAPLLKTSRRVIRDSDALKKAFDKKISSMIAHFRGRAIEVVPQVVTFSDMLLYMNLLEDANEIPYTPDEIRAMTYEEIVKNQVHYQKIHQSITQGFFENPQTAFGEPIIALWLERQLLDSGLIATAAQSADQETLRKLQSFFVVRSDEVSSDTSDLEKNKPIRYNLLPLFSLIDPEKRQEIYEMLSPELYGDDVETLTGEEVIWLLASEISATVAKTPPQSHDKNSAITLGHVRKFGEKWVRKNWKWLFAELQQSVIQPARQPKNGKEAVAPEAKVGVDEPLAEVQELEKEIEVLKRGALGGWKVFYTTNPRLLDKDLVEIAGETLAKREENLAHFFGTNNISCTLASGTVLDQLGQVLEMPEEDKIQRKRQAFSGVTYYKESVGQVRILYVMEEGQKVLKFFVHQKKAWGYRFN